MNHSPRLTAATVDLVKHLARYFKPYVSIAGKDGDQTYDYLAKGLPKQVKAKCTLHRPKITPDEDEYLYIATPLDATLADLKVSERLYVGCDKSERMFRGDGLNGQNFNHTAMRKGKGENANLNVHLRNGGTLRVHLLGKNDFKCALAEVAEVAWLEPLLRSPTNPSGTLHLGRRLESVILHYEGPAVWVWNSKGPDRVVVSLLRELEARKRQLPAVVGKLL